MLLSLYNAMNYKRDVITQPPRLYREFADKNGIRHLVRASHRPLGVTKGEPGFLIDLSHGI